MKLVSTATLQIRKPIHEVYQTITMPEHMTKYFISESSGRLETAQDLEWKFPEFDMRFPITQVKTEENKSISFVWDPDTVVSIELTPFGEDNTIVKVTEDGKEMNDENMKWLISNVGGWANFLASMKAYIEYGVELRKGAYDFMKGENP